MFAIFDSIDIFINWHENIKSILGYPIFGTNQSSGEIDYENPITNYSKPICCNNKEKVIAFVGEYIEGLKIIDPKDYPEYFPQGSLVF